MSVMRIWATSVMKTASAPCLSLTDISPRWERWFESWIEWFDRVCGDAVEGGGVVGDRAAAEALVTGRDEAMVDTEPTPTVRDGR